MADQGVLSAEKYEEIIKQKDAIIADLLKKLHKQTNFEWDIDKCSYCTDYEIKDKEGPLDVLTICSNCHKVACEDCAHKHHWMWQEDIDEIDDPPYYTDYFCDPCAAELIKQKVIHGGF